MGEINIDNTGSGAAVTLSSDGSSLLLGGSAVGGGGGGGASAITLANKTGNYTVVAGDLGKMLTFSGSGTGTFALTAAATLGSGWFCYIVDNGTATANQLTIDPNGSETINLKTTHVFAAGAGIKLICDGSNFFTEQPSFDNSIAINKPAAFSKAVATGYGAIAISTGQSSGNGAYGQNSVLLNAGTGSAGSSAIAIGVSSNATGNTSLATQGGTASGWASIGIKAYVSGQDSVGIGIHTGSSYGVSASEAVAIGYLSKATQTNNVAIGKGAIASGNQRATAIGREALASGNESCAIGTVGAGGTNGALGDYSVAVGSHALAQLAKATCIGYYAMGRELATALGNNARSLATRSVALGTDSEVMDSSTGGMALGSYSYVPQTRHGAIAFNNGVRFAADGDSQAGLFILRSDTTDATAEAMTTNNATATSTNQITIPTDSCITFSGTIVAMQNGAQAYGSWKIEGLLVNDGGTTTVPTSAITIINNSSSWGLALSADNTNNALAVTVTGEASHNIRWVANVQTSEVTFA